eukprot:79816-Prymnesium_polylepis.3
MAGCDAALAAGQWLDREFQWRNATECGFRWRDRGNAKALLQGKHLLFLGNSAMRRMMYATLHALTGAVRGVRVRTWQRPHRRGHRTLRRSKCVRLASIRWQASNNSQCVACLERGERDVYDSSTHEAIVSIVDLTAEKFKDLGPGGLCGMYRFRSFTQETGKGRSGNFQRVTVTVSWLAHWQAERRATVRGRDSSQRGRSPEAAPTVRASAPRLGPAASQGTPLLVDRTRWQYARHEARLRSQLSATLGGNGTWCAPGRVSAHGHAARDESGKFTHSGLECKGEPDWMLRVRPSDEVEGASHVTAWLFARTLDY